VDISPTMVENANRFNKHPTTCSYLVNHAPNLPMFRDGQLAFIYTSIVLQHMRPELAEGYLREFARVLAPGGVMVFQMPDHENLTTVVRLRRSLRLRTTARRVLSTFGLAPRPYRSEMNCVPEPRLRKLMTGLGLRLVDVQFTNSAEIDFNGDLKFLDREPATGSVSKQYCVVKPAPREGA
jgi:SAM-dependent methyltransferase